jgi:hypothetical protein
MTAMISHPREDEVAPVSPVSSDHYNDIQRASWHKSMPAAGEDEVNSASSEKAIDTKLMAKTTWKPKWSRVGPMLGLSALILTVLSIPAEFGILRASDGDLVSSWKYSPNVYLGILTAFTSKATSLAALQGAVVAWWLRAMRGTTLKQLHRDWAMGQNI